MLAFCTLNFTDVDDSKEKTSAKSFRRNLFGKSSGSSSDTVPPSEYAEFGANGKQMGSIVCFLLLLLIHYTICKEFSKNHNLYFVLFLLVNNLKFVFLFFF